MTAIENVARLREVVPMLDARKVAIEVERLTSARVAAWAPKLTPGALSEEPPMLVRDAYDRFLDHHHREFRRAVEVATSALERALAAQQCIVTILSLDEAQALLDAETEDDTVPCAHCGDTINRTKGQRVVSGRCFACYEYRRRHGVDAPPHVLAERIERALEAAAKEGEA